MMAFFPPVNMIPLILYLIPWKFQWVPEDNFCIVYLVFGVLLCMVISEECFKLLHLSLVRGLLGHAGFFYIFYPWRLICAGILECSPLYRVIQLFFACGVVTLEDFIWLWNLSQYSLSFISSVPVDIYEIFCRVCGWVVLFGPAIGIKISIEMFSLWQAESAIAALNCSGAVLGSLPIRFGFR